MSTLDDIGREEGSDRSSRVHGYLDSYEAILEPIRSQPTVLLEIGGRTAAHAKMWLEYFETVDIYVLERNPDKQLLSMPNVTVLRPDRFESAEILAEMFSIRPDVVIDDGTHRYSDHLIALESIFPLLKPGGLYCIEDLHTSFGPRSHLYSSGAGSSADLIRDVAEHLLSGAPKKSSSLRISDYILSSIGGLSVQRQLAVLRKSVSAGKPYRRVSVGDASVADRSSNEHSEPYARVESALVGASHGVEAAFNRLQSESIVKFPVAVTAEVEEVTVVSGGIAVDGVGRIFEETLNCVQNQKETSLFRQLPGVDQRARLWVSKRQLRSDHRVEASRDTVHVLLKSAWDKNYGHWLYDSLSRLHLLNGYDLGGRRPVLVLRPQQGPMKAVVEDSVELAGFDISEVVFDDGFADTVYSRLVIPGLQSSHPSIKSPAATKYLEWLGRDVPAGGARKLYISRNSYSRRRLLNEDEVWPIFKAAGFTMVAGETLTLREQIALFKGASVVAGNLGAAFSNLAFSPQGVRVLALTTPSMHHDFFYDIVCHKQGAYFGLQGSSSELKPTMSSDFYVPPLEVENLLREVDL